MKTEIAPAVRSRMMRAVRSRDTKPELLVRKLLHSLGYRYRLHSAAMPGRLRPDIVFRARRKVIYVHGCFWHAHPHCSRAHMPNGAYWQAKLARNQARDERALAALKEAGWEALVIWECEMSDRESLAARLSCFLGA